jgi:hypothetical protein
MLARTSGLHISLYQVRLHLGRQRLVVTKSFYIKYLACILIKVLPNVYM